MKRKNMLIILVLLIFFSIGTQAFGENNDNNQIYFLSINRLAFEDFQEVSNLKFLGEEGSLGLMNTRGTNGYYGSESFLTINSSSKAYANDLSVEFVYSESTDEIINESINSIYKLNENNGYSPKIGYLGNELKNNSKRSALFADNTLDEENLLYSGLIGMDSNGIISEGIIDNLTIKDANYPFKKKMDYKKLLSESINSNADFKIIDIGDLERLYRYGNNYSEDEYLQKRKNILNDIDIFIEELLKNVDFKKSTLIITSPNATDTIIDKNKLSPILFYGREIPKGELLSNTTNRNGIIANIDLAPTILNLLGIDSTGSIGKIVSFDDDIDKSIEEKIIEKNKIYTVSSVRYKSLLYYGICSIIILVLILLVKIARIRLSMNFKNIMRILLEMILLMPTLYLITSIFQPTNSRNYIGLILLLLVVSIIVLYVLRRINMNKKLLIFSSFNIIILLLDLILKGQISQFSVLSHDPIIGARYYGMGNEMVGILLASIAILLKQLKILGINKNVNILILMTGLFFIASPKLGANVGGSLALLVTLIFYFLLEKEIEIDIKKILIIAVTGIAILGIIAIIDIKFNTNTTHLGNTILSIKDEGLSLIIQIIFRKLLMNIKLIGRSFWTFVLLTSLLVFSGGIYYNEIYDSDLLKVTIAIIIGALAGFLLNDSGLILSAFCMNLLAAEHILMGSEKIEEK